MKKDKLTFEERFDNLMSSLEELRDSQKETDRKMAETDRKMAETDRKMAETDRRIKETNKSVFGISTSNGMIAEEMVYESLLKDMTFGDIKFDNIIKNFRVQSEDLQPKTDIDVLMVNGDTIALIEVKYKVEKDDLTDLVNSKIKLFRQHYPRYRHHKIVLGIGGMGFEDGVLQSATKKGVGVIKVIGDKVEYNTENIKQY